VPYLARVEAIDPTAAPKLAETMRLMGYSPEDIHGELQRRRYFTDDLGPPKTATE
jgi:hypothetical protein